MNNNSLPSLSNKRKLTEQQQNFLSALAVQAKGNINKALDMAGYKETSYYNVINNLKDEIVEVATKILAKSAPQASQKLVEILESDDPIPQVNAKLQAAQTLLDRVGVAKRDKLDITHTSASGIFLLPTKLKLFSLNTLRAMFYKTAVFVIKRNSSSEILDIYSIIQSEEDRATPFKIDALLQNTKELKKIQKENYQISLEYNFDSRYEIIDKVVTTII